MQIIGWTDISRLSSLRAPTRWFLMICRLFNLHAAGCMVPCYASEREIDEPPHGRARNCTQTSDSWSVSSVYDLYCPCVSCTYPWLTVTGTVPALTGRPVSDYTGFLAKYIPTMSRLGPTSWEFQFQEKLLGHIVYPSACLLVSTKYLKIIST